MSNNPTGSTNSTLDELFEQVDAAFNSIWEMVAAPDSNLHTLPANLHSSLSELYNKLTQGGTLPTLPEWKDVGPAVWSPPAPPPPPPVRHHHGHALACATRKHPYLFAFVATSSVLGASYYLFPKQFLDRANKIVKPLKPFIPLQLLPESDRPLRVQGPHGEIRKEAVLILGAEGVARELALDLEKRGYVVIATVSDPASVEVLEKRSRGWMKVLVLEPTDVSSPFPFFHATLPIDPRASPPSSAPSPRPYRSASPSTLPATPSPVPLTPLALTALVNCLPLVPSTGLAPLEGIEMDQVRVHVGERLATFVGVLGGVMPILRTASGRPAAPEGVILNLVPATNNVALPFQSLSTASDTALLALLHSLRRELTASRSSNLRIAILEVGYFDFTPSASPAPAQAEPLSNRLQSIYAPALARRLVSNAGNTVTNTRTKWSQPRRLGKKVFNTLVHGRGGRRSGVGAGALTYHLASYLPTLIIDSFLSFHDRLISIILSQTSLLPPPAPIAPLDPTTPRASRTTLPTPPTGVTPPSSSEEHEDSGSEEGKSSIEDFGAVGGSFVGSEAGWREGEQPDR